MNKYIENFKVKDLKPYANNPRVNKKAVAFVAKSIEAVGFGAPISVDKDFVIIAGHTRWKAAKKLKLKTVPVVVHEDMSVEKVNEYRLLDNKASEYSGWENEMLAVELELLKDVPEWQQFKEDFDLLEDNKPEQIEQNYNSVFSIIIEVETEDEQQKLYERLKEEGYKCKVMSI